MNAGRKETDPVTYDASFFDEPIDRHGTDCEKWDGLMAREGRELLPMWVADMDFRCTPEISEALAKRALHPVYGYTDATEASVAAMLDYVWRHYGVRLDAHQQAMLPCVVTGLRAAVRTQTAPGDSVLIQTPVYGPFFSVVTDNDRKLVTNPLIPDAEGRYRMNLEGMEEAFRRGVKLALLCSPHNPVSRVWTKEELADVYALCMRYDVTLVVDEIHADFVYEPGAFTSALHLDDREEAKLIVLSSASKTFNIAGMRQAVMFTRNRRLIRELVNDMRNAGVVAGNIFSFAATEAAYRYGDAWLEGLIRYLDSARRLLKEQLSQRLPKAVLTPVEATYLAWIDLRAYGFSTAELMKRTYDQGVAFTSGLFFDLLLGEGFLRFNFACPHSQTLEAVARLEKAIKTNA